MKALGILRELGQFDGRFYASDGDEDYIVNESDLDDESEYDSSEDDEPLDKNGKRGTCRH